MPIPRRNQNEFFIPKYNILPVEHNNQAVIYVPQENLWRQSSIIHKIMNIGRFNFFEEENHFFRYLNFRTFTTFLRSSQNLRFISDITRILSNTRNENDSNSFRNSVHFDENVIEKLLQEFVGINNNDIITTTKRFIEFIPNNERIRNYVGREYIKNFEKNVYDYYNKLLSEKKKKEIKMLHKQFKEFKVYQHYYGKKMIHDQLKYKIKDCSKFTKKIHYICLLHH